MKNNWDIKFIRDGFLMPFGSMCNAFGLVNEGKGMLVKDFLKSMNEIERKAIEITENAVNRAEEAIEDNKPEEEKVINIDKDGYDKGFSQGFRRGKIREAEFVKSSGKTSLDVEREIDEEHRRREKELGSDGEMVNDDKKEERMNGYY